jgi:hypothetical protein
LGRAATASSSLRHGAWGVDAKPPYFPSLWRFCSTGHVWHSAKGRGVGINERENYLQTDAAINPGTAFYKMEILASLTDAGLRSSGLRFVTFFPLRCTSLAFCGIRDGVQAGLGDLFTALLASSIAAVFDPLECCINLVENVFVASEQSKREFLISIITPNLFAVGRYADGLGVVLQGIIFHLSHVSQQTCPQSQESFKMTLQVSVHHLR